MKFLYLYIFIFVNLSAFTQRVEKPIYSVDVLPKSMSVAEKKRRFFYLLLPPINKIHQELTTLYKGVEIDLRNKRNLHKTAYLKKVYMVKTDKELLMALKPHPKSITLAQAAIESAWGTSRFFREANNVFGMWSSNKNEPRVAARVKRNGSKVIWLRKFKSIEESVRAYYMLLARGRAFKEFRKLRYESDNVYEILKGLRNYSERHDEYVKELSEMIRYNKLEKYD
jgi:Bax protein